MKKSVQMIHVSFLKPLWLMLVILLGFGTLTACGSASAEEPVEPLASVTELPKNGIITKAQLSTIKAKSGTYEFKGTSNGFAYTWAYDAAQIKNPTDQHLKLDITTKNLKKIKAAADDAPYALSVAVADFELAGSPHLSITVPQKWEAKAVYLAAMQKGELRKISSAAPSLTDKGGKTTLSATITLSNTTLYFVAGGSSKAADNLGEASGGDDVSRETSEGSSSSGGSTTTEEGDIPGSGSSQPSSPKSSQNDDTISVTLSIDAKTLVGHLDEVKQEKRAFVPSDGWILKPIPVELTQGQNVYDALVKATKSRSIQMESRWTPLYGSYYVNGINQLYERDAGGLSGWMYSVDGWYSNYGASSYSALHDGSTIQWRYTRDLGADLGVTTR